uniref:HD2 homeodomain mating-type protein n=1 Tax=Volvariella volvacea TaxID=36659 RepID=G9I6E3_9AGAR|nr:HD2 homeodomain mating-type protein [Volvariella volvacea]
MSTSLVQISKSSERLLRLLGPQHAATAQAPFSPPELLLTIPDSIYPRLITLGVHPLTAERLSNTFQTHVKQLRASYTRKYHSICNSCEVSNIMATCRIMREAYLKRVAQWEEMMISKVLSGTDTRSKNPPFNHAYTPILEKYFESNAYPSAADRAVLARKSDMTPRQIEVWFQNHRTRAKKEGRRLRKLADRQCTVLQSPERTPNTVGSTPDRVSIEAGDLENGVCSFFDYTPSPKTFPLPYARNIATHTTQIEYPNEQCARCTGPGKEADGSRAAMVLVNSCAPFPRTPTCSPSSKHSAPHPLQKFSICTCSSSQASVRRSNFLPPANPMQPPSYYRPCDQIVYSSYYVLSWWYSSNQHSVSHTISSGTDASKYFPARLLSSDYRRSRATWQYLLLVAPYDVIT